MTVYCCPNCKIVLTFGAFKGKENVCIPHSDDWFSCEVCGMKYCRDCGERINSCRQCNGSLHFNKFFEPEGIYRLPKYPRELKTLKKRLTKIEEEWEAGVIGSGEYKYLKKVTTEEAEHKSSPD